MELILTRSDANGTYQAGLDTSFDDHGNRRLHARNGFRLRHLDQLRHQVQRHIGGLLLPERTGTRAERRRPHHRQLRGERSPRATTSSKRLSTSRRPPRMRAFSKPAASKRSTWPTTIRSTMASRASTTRRRTSRRRTSPTSATAARPPTDGERHQGRPVRHLPARRDGQGDDAHAKRYQVPARRGLPSSSSARSHWEHRGRERARERAGLAGACGNRCRVRPGDRRAPAGAAGRRVFAREPLHLLLDGAISALAATPIPPTSTR